MSRVVRTGGLINRPIRCLTLLIAFVAADQAAAQNAQPGMTVEDLLAGNFSWTVSRPLLSAEPSRLPPSAEDNPWVAVKDPSLVRFQNRWNLFCSLRKQKGGQGRIRIGHLSFEDWTKAPQAEWSLLKLTDDYHGAPQVFFFEPHRKWYLIYQAADQSRGIRYGPCYSTNDDITDAKGWTLPTPLYKVKPGKKAGLDFWVICDDAKAHLFFTSLDGQMWRSETKLDAFPGPGWTEPKVVLKADIFEASHTYRLKGLGKYLTLVEAQNGSRRYFKAYLADRLDGDWSALAASRKRPFASVANVANQSESWTTSYSHGELIRLGVNQQLEVDPARLEFVFQGVDGKDRKRTGYGAIPWRLGVLK